MVEDTDGGAFEEDEQDRAAAWLELHGCTDPAVIESVCVNLRSSTCTGAATLGLLARLESLEPGDLRRRVEVAEAQVAASAAAAPVLEQASALMVNGEYMAAGKLYRKVLGIESEH
eukprot:SAG31_NODE_22672_length_520_cov_0.959620_1_plen_115_part_01